MQLEFSQQFFFSCQEHKSKSYKKKIFQKLKEKTKLFSRRDRGERLRVKQAAAKWQQYHIL
jgi:hypothetical protein